MATSIRLFQFPSKPSPVPADIVYLGDSAASFDEVQSTIAELIGAYPVLLGMGGLTLGNNSYAYVNGTGTYTAGSITALGIALLADSTTAQAATTLAVLQLAGGTMAGAINMGTFGISNAANPTNPQDLATKFYVDSIAQGITVQGACRLGTTGALTVVYSNGASGVGATLTNNGAQAALTLDGVAAVVNDRILVKNQASALQNGIYTVTSIGSGASNWVMTRALDYNQPAEINPGDLVVITAGNTLTSSSWLQTATVTTVGTDAINFSQFSAALPISLANGGTGAALTASNGGIVYSNASTLAILAGTATANQVLLSGSSTTPAWSTATYPATTTINQLLYSSSANTIVGLATANSGVLVTSSSGVPSIATGGQIPATATNNNASAGNIGEFVSSTIAFGSAVTYNTNTPTDITSISLTAGDWVVYGNVGFNNNAVGMALATCWISTTSATLPDPSLRNTIFLSAAAGMSSCGIQAPSVRISIASTTTVYLSCEATFASGTQTGYGGIYARRAR